MLVCQLVGLLHWQESDDKAMMNRDVSGSRQFRDGFAELCWNCTEYNSCDYVPA